jgi:hypothetical protein
MSAIFGPADGRPERSLQDFLPLTNSNSSARSDKKPEAKDTSQSAAVIPSEAEALYDLKAIPLYFPASYSLVKPYVQGFEPNGLDVLSLKDIRIDYNWQPKRPSNES